MTDRHVPTFTLAEPDVWDGDVPGFIQWAPPGAEEYALIPTLPYVSVSIVDGDLSLYDFGVKRPDADEMDARMDLNALRLDHEGMPQTEREAATLGITTIMVDVFHEVIEFTRDSNGERFALAHWDHDAHSPDPLAWLTERLQGLVQEYLEEFGPKEDDPASHSRDSVQP